MADVRLQVNLRHTPHPIWVNTLLAEPPLPIIIINFIDSCQQDFGLWIKSEYLGTIMRNF